MSFKDLIIQIKKKYVNITTSDLAKKLLCIYFSNYYTGKEHDYMLLKYAENIYFEFWLYLGNVIQNAETNTINIEKHIDKASKRCYTLKKLILERWKHPKPSNHGFVNYLKTFYTLDEEELVKDELGL